MPIILIEMVWGLPRSGLLEQNTGEGPGLLRGLSEVPGLGKFKLLLEFLGLKAWPSTPRYAKKHTCQNLLK